MEGLAPETQLAFPCCLGGKHTPVNPHRQRLLVASHKAAKLASTAKTAAPAAKHAPAKHAAAAATATEAPKLPQDTAGAAKMPVKRNDTMYGTERKKFLSQPHGLHIPYWRGSSAVRLHPIYDCKV